jgi:D-alanine-D-alanine ligase
MTTQVPWDAIRTILGSVREASEEYTVAVVANLKQHGVERDYGDGSVATEYLSQAEAAQIMGALQSNGFYTKFYGGELPFISAVLGGEFDRLPRKNKLVYNLAQSGTGIGRKSLVPSFCRMLGLASCNSDSYAVSLARHKFHVYCVLRNLGIPVADSWLFDTSGTWLQDLCPPPETPLICKACYESASIGLTRESVGELSEEYHEILRNKAAALRQPIIVQRLIEGYEFEVPLLMIGGDLIAFDPVAITLDGNATLGSRILDYDTVEYDSFGFAPPSLISSDTREKLKQAAKATFKALGIGCIGRVDFRVASQDQSVYVTDVATSPHLIEHSSFAYTFGTQEMSYADLLGSVIAANAVRQGWLNFPTRPECRT